MRIDKNELPEILEAIEQDGKYFAIVGLERMGADKQFKFGLNQNGYITLKKALQLRPFDQAPGVLYRYYFYPTVGRLNKERATMAVRIEQGSEGKNIEVEADLELVANLKWFYELKDPKEAEKFAAT